MAYTVINKGNDHFRVKEYAGNGSARSLTWDESTNMQPDMMWFKNQSRNSYWTQHTVNDGATKMIHSQRTDGLTTDANQLASFDTNGFSVGTSTNQNASGESILSWGWKGGGAASSNSDGSVNSTVSVNTAAGISLVKWTGGGSVATVGHGLGAVPAFMIFKKTSTGGDNWYVYHKSLGATKYFHLNNTTSVGTGSSPFNDTAPTSSVFTAGSDLSASADYIGYVFAEVQGFSSFGTYVGNASTNGPFIYTGFKPEMMILKGSSIVTDWNVMTSKASPSQGGNPAENLVWLNLVSQESAGYDQDMVSNGVKLRNTGSYRNGNGETYIYAAWARSPFVGTNNTPTNAR